MSKHQTTSQIGRCGSTFLEIVMATLITGTMLVGSLNGVGAVFETNQQNADRLIGPGLAHELMTEILSMPYKDTNNASTNIGIEGAETNASRVDFDDIDDYHGLNVLGVRKKDGTVRADLSGWRQQVSVEWIEILTGLPWILGDTGLKRITVTITSPGGEVTQLRAFRFKEGALDVSPVIDTDVVSFIGAELRLSDDAATARMGTYLPNYAPEIN